MARQLNTNLIGMPKANERVFIGRSVDAVGGASAHGRGYIRAEARTLSPPLHRCDSAFRFFRKRIKSQILSGVGSLGCPCNRCPRPAPLRYASTNYRYIGIPVYRYASMPVCRYIGILSALGALQKDVGGRYDPVDQVS